MIFVASINIQYHWLIVTSDFKVVTDPPTLFNNVELHFVVVIVNLQIFLLT
jgi:hypothetical protein